MVEDPHKLGFYKQKTIVKIQIQELIKRNVPCTFEKLLALIQIETGLSKKKAKEYLEMFSDVDHIKINNITHEVTLCPRK